MNSYLAVKTVKDSIKYPCLAKLIMSESDPDQFKIVLFRNRAEGTVVHSSITDPDCGLSHVGDYSNDWYPLDAADSGWEILPPNFEIKLSN